MKQRVSGLDLQLLAEELRTSLESYRLSNIYNVVDSSKQFLLKFAKPDSKINVVVDSGSRVHITNFTRHTPQAPSGFVAKLRKHLKGKRLTAFRQIPNDRILVLQFADGLYYLVLEFFSAGNVMLLDENRKILSLQRIVSEHENKVGETYKMFDESLMYEVPEADTQKTQFTASMIKSWIESIGKEQDVLSMNATITAGGKKKKQLSIHKLLLKRQPHLSSDLLSNNLKKEGINPSEACLEFIGREDEIAELLLDTQKEYLYLIEARNKRGYIVAKKNNNFDSTKDDLELEYIYENFHPFKPFIDEEEKDLLRLFQIEGDYNKTVDTFFSTIESNRLALRVQNQEMQAKKRLDDARSDNNKKIQALVELQTSNETKAQIIINHANIVEEAKAAVQSLIDQQTDWNTIEKLIQSEQKKGNKIASVIQLPLNLKKNKISIRLPLESTSDDFSNNDDHHDFLDTSSYPPDSSDSSDSSDSDEETKEDIVAKSTKKKKDKKNLFENTVVVTIDLSLSAYANASQYFNAKKNSSEKQKKVEKNIEKAMKNIETKIDQQLKKKLKETHEVLKKLRTPYFFEKYNWFISSEGFLVLLGRSPIETDQIFSRYIEEDDIYMSNNFDTHVWIKNPEKTEVPPNTLMQAGIFCMSASEAWSKKISSSAWWCYASNITKFDERNALLGTGVFRIKNESKINNLSPSQLVMGIAFLWKVKNDKSYSNDEDNEQEESENEEHEQISDRTAVGNDITNNNNASDKLQDVSVESYNNFSGILETDKKMNIGNVIDTSHDSDSEVGDRMSVATNVIKNMNRNVRGKKGKLKKMQKKYADQDEQERLIRLDVLGTLKGIEKQEEKKEKEAMKQEEREYKKNKREIQREKQALKFTVNEKVKISYERFKDDLKPFLTNEDEVIDIVPVFAPWPALLKYKFKVKIQPGNAKKTKSMTEVLRYFTTRKVDNESVDKELVWPVEYSLIKSIKEGDLIPLLCVDKLNISLPGGKTNKQGASSKQKSNKKSNTKN